MAIYLDHNATTPVDSEVLAEMLPFLTESFGNPSSVHRFGQVARRGIDLARERVSALIGAAPEEIIFTSGGTEADHLAIKGVLKATRRKGHIIISQTEHPAVLGACISIERMGSPVTRLSSDESGHPRVADVAEALTAETVLVSLMLANNDVGTIAPLEDISRVVSRTKALLHTDAVQALGKIPVDVNRLGVDLMSISSHKIYGPKGVGALYQRRGTPLRSLLSGGHQEREMRGGTENVPGIVGFGKACELASQRLAADMARIEGLRDELERGLLSRIPGIQFNGKGYPRLPGTSNMRIEGINGDDLVMALDLKGIAVSTGAACNSQTREPSHVLTAMGCSFNEARSVIRCSLGRSTTQSEVASVIEAMAEVVPRMRGSH